MSKNNTFKNPYTRKVPNYSPPKYKNTLDNNSDNNTKTNKTRNGENNNTTNTKDDDNIITKETDNNIKTVIYRNNSLTNIKNNQDNQNNFVLNSDNDNDNDNTINNTNTNINENNLDFTKSHLKSVNDNINNYPNNDNLPPSFNLNIEEIFEFEEKKKKINTEKVVNSWTKDREDLVNNWIKELEFYQIIIYFHLFHVKKIENMWAWIIIVLSTLVSTISLIQFDKDEEDKDLVLIINILVTLLTTFITLIAAWMKKQNYVSIISECEKYLQSLSGVLAELNGQIKIIREDRVEFQMFLEKYKDKVIQFSSGMPLISPYDWKHTVYLLTKYYPELIQNTYPWDENDDFSKLILLTYHKVKYRTLFRRCVSGYYCYSSCCKPEYESAKSLRDYFNQKNKIKELETLNYKKDLETIYYKKDKIDTIKSNSSTSNSNSSNSYSNSSTYNSNSSNNNDSNRIVTIKNQPSFKKTNSYSSIV